MTTYFLIAVLLSGDTYVERRNLTLNDCATYAALTAIQTYGMNVKYRCKKGN
jgi:hypothetical protein